MKRKNILNIIIACSVIAIVYVSGCKKEDSAPASTTPTGNASGDLSGNFPGPVVSKIQGRALSAIAPTDGQALLWNNTSSLWEPKTIPGLDIWTRSGNNAYISLTGNLGIGTASPTDEIHIKKDVNSFVGITIENTDPGTSSTERLSFNNENGSVALLQVRGAEMTLANNRPSGLIEFNTGGNTKMIVTNGGNVGIGTTAPNQKLSVNGNICATGTIGACSDIRYKKDITSMTDALVKTMSLHGIYYNWDKKKIGAAAYTPQRQIGFSAQEIEEYFPEIVQTDSRGYKAVDYGRLTPILVEAIKEQQQQIDELKKMVVAALNR